VGTVPNIRKITGIAVIDSVKSLLKIGDIGPGIPKYVPKERMEKGRSPGALKKGRSPALSVHRRASTLSYCYPIYNTRP